MNDTEELSGVRQWASMYIRLRISDVGTLREEMIDTIVSDYWRYREKGSMSNVNVDDEFLTGKEKGFQAGLARAIADRRLADHYRSRYRFRNRTELSDTALVDLPSQAPSPLTVATHQEIVIELLSMMTALPESERNLLLRSVSESEDDRALSSNERKRLSRTRKMLKQKMFQRFGDSINSLLEIDD